MCIIYQNPCPKYDPTKATHLLTPPGQWSDLRSNRFAGGGHQDGGDDEGMGESEKHRFGEFLQLAKCEMNGYRGKFRINRDRNWSVSMSFLTCFHGRFPESGWSLQTISIRWKTPTHQGEKATRCHVCFLVGDSWKVQKPRWFGQCCTLKWFNSHLNLHLQFLSLIVPECSGRGHHKPHHKLLYSGGVKSDDVWPFSLWELRPKKVAILNFSLLCCKVFTFQYISTKPWKITFLNYTLIWLYNLHIHLYTPPWNNRKLTWKPKLYPDPWKKRFGSLDSSRGTVARRVALRLQRRKCWVTSVGHTNSKEAFWWFFQILHHQPSHQPKTSNILNLKPENRASIMSSRALKRGEIHALSGDQQKHNIT